ncbi:MAG: hypothetical protein KGO02_25690 [Alphaproteobacteria bacterium]|nr:hypothetical protein [Alphaproteobacteria bacterium]
MAIPRPQLGGHSRRHLRRALSIVGAALMVGIVTLVFRTLSAGGSFVTVNPGYSGRCALTARLAVRDIAIDARSGLAFLAVAAVRANAADGIYLADPAHPERPPLRLPGVPPGFHPDALSLWRDQAGGLVLFAASPGPGSGSVDAFSVQLGAHPALTETADIGSSLFAHVRAVAAVDANRFYAIDAPPVGDDFFSLLLSYLTPAHGRIIFYDGEIPHIVAKGLRAPRGLALSADGSRLYVGLSLSRTLASYSVEPFLGHLTAAGTYPLPLAPAHLSRAGGTSLLVAGDPKLFARATFAKDPSQPSPSAVVRVHFEGDAPHGVTQIYADMGHGIAAADVAVEAGRRLLIGSALDDRLLSCTPAEGR